MRLILICVFLLIASTTVVESFLLSALVGFKIGYALASRNRGGYRRSYGHGRRWGRSIEDSTDLQLEQIMLKASIEDNDDCAKAFVCYANAKSSRVTPIETFAYEFFGSNSKNTDMIKTIMPVSSEGLTIVDALSPTVQFDLAAQVGRIGGAQHCQQIYARCPLPYNELLSILEGKISTPRQEIY